ncbi:MAG TPA: AIPR family protein [Burkholderiaceae bacterium]|nr:AIPR family protein [Burkholderiaceae bacterium]
MNLNAQIIDQRVRATAEKLQPELVDACQTPLEGERLRSVAFVYLCIKTMLDLPQEDSLDTLTEGGNDFGVDAMHVGEARDGEFYVTLLQSKYKHKDLSGTAHFPANAVDKMLQALTALFNPWAPLTLNPRLQAQVEQVRSLINDGYLPRVRCLMCNNGTTWNANAQQAIDRAKLDGRVTFEHVNHDRLIQVLQAVQPVKDKLRFSGKSMVEDFNFSRVFVGKVAVTEIARLMQTHGDRLLERNIRRYLGLQGNRVNEGIQATLLSAEERPHFFFYNNGVTMLCSRFDYNALQPENHTVSVEGLQIINGGQTCKTIATTLEKLAEQLPLAENHVGLEQAYVLVRLYQLGDDGADLVPNITYATNSQNPVDLRDLRSNDPIQRKLMLGTRELGFDYKPKRGDEALKSTDVTSAVAAEAVLSVWRMSPQQAKFRNSEHFAGLYDKIFQGLNPAQLVTATLLYRVAENHRRRPRPGDPDLVRYGSCFAAMLMGQALLKDLGCALDELSHQNFEQAKRLIDQKAERYFQQAVKKIETALRKLYGRSQVITLQQLSATFRRGDLSRYLTD